MSHTSIRTCTEILMPVYVWAQPRHRSYTHGRDIQAHPHRHGQTSIEYTHIHMHVHIHACTQTLHAKVHAYTHVHTHMHTHMYMVGSTEMT